MVNNNFPKYNSTEKLKFINKNRMFDNMSILSTPKMYPTSNFGKLEYTNVESILTRPAVQNTVRKDYVKEIDCCKTHCEFNRNNTDVVSKYGEYDNEIQEDMQTTVRRKDMACYKRTGNRSAGRGIGNVHADSYIRYGNDTRNDMETIADVELDKYKFHYHFRNYQDPNHIVFPLPRGGIDTRNLDKYTKLQNY
jgi:hypothetical protein